MQWLLDLLACSDGALQVITWGKRPLSCTFCDGGLGATWLRRAEALIQHPVEDLGRALRILGLRAGADQGTAGDDVWHEALILHPAAVLGRALRILSLLAGADQGTVGDDV